MNTSDIEVFLRAAEAQSFSKAAEENYLSRQAVSRKIAALEKELGTLLFQRAPIGQRITLTPEGQKYYEFFCSSKTRWEELQANMHKEFGNRIIRIAYLEGLDFPPLLQQILVDVRNKYGAEGRWNTYDMHNLKTVIDGDEYDLVLAYDGPRLNLFKSYSHTFVGHIPMVLVVRKGLRPDAKTAMDFSDMPVATWMRKGQTVEEAIEKCTDHCLDFGFHCTDIKVFPNRDTVRASIEFGDCVGICTEIDRVAQSNAVETFPLQGYSALTCLWKKNERDPVILSVIQKLKDKN